ncbi:MAG: hypothetical protein NTW19_12970 [Planctomycetota bacterium]|nr:hypothetical protein [Planctomycetota bacterium]
MSLKPTRSLAGLMVLASLMASTALAADAPAPASKPAAAAPASAPASQPAVPVRTTLPDAYPYQRQLRAYMATLKENDFDHGIEGYCTKQPWALDAEGLYREHLFTMSLQPMIGTKRGAPSVFAPPAAFVLSAIESPEGVRRPPIWPESLTAFERWPYPGNPFFNNRGLRMRAFVTSAVKLMMIQDHIDNTPLKRRSDWLGYELVSAGACFRAFKDDLPPDVRKAFADGMVHLGRLIISFGPRREEPNLDLTAPLGLWYAADAARGPAFSAEAEAYAKMLFTDPRYFNPAGYFVERGGTDLAFGGMSNFFAVWLALASDWPFVKESVDKVYRLRAHLMLPEPDSRYTAPTHFHTRIGAPASEDQWDWGFRDYAAAMVTDEAIYLLKPQTEEQLAGGADVRAGIFNHAMGETAAIAKNRKTDVSKIRGSVWSWHLWDNLNFPATVNYAHDFYRPGSYAHRLKLQEANSPMLKSPFLRDGNFARRFGDAFVVVKRAGYSAIIHTGPVGDQNPDDGLAQFKGPLGLGGGQLSAFWTPKSWSVLMGRRTGMGWDASREKVEEWRIWPIHAVSGQTAQGKVFTSARIATPSVAWPDTSDEVMGDAGSVRVSGTIPSAQLEQGAVLSGVVDYARTFKLGDKGVSVETLVKSDGKDQVAELYETIPAFIGDTTETLKPEKRSTIEFNIDGKWGAPATEFGPLVSAVRVKRFEGGVVITFDKPRRVKLAATDWVDGWFTRATCRNLMIDLLESDGKVAAMPAERKVSYTVEPSKE